MAKITTTAVVDQARGKSGGVVFTKGHAGPNIRRHVAPSQPRTPRQHAIRAGLTQFTKDWGSVLSDAQRLAWSTLASSVKRSNSLGTKHTLTGLALFVSCNQNLALVNVAEMVDAPASLQPQQLTALDASSAFVEILGTTGITQSGGNNTVAYVLGTNVAPVIGDHVTISGYADPGNNGDFTVTGVGSGTLTVAAPAGVTAATTGRADVLHFAPTVLPMPGSGNSALAYAASKPVSAGRTTTFPSPAFITYEGDPYETNLNISAPYAAKYGHPTAGKKVKLVVWVIDESTGAASAKWSAIAAF